MVKQPDILVPGDENLCSRTGIGADSQICSTKTQYGKRSNLKIHVRHTDTTKKKYNVEITFANDRSYFS